MEAITLCSLTSADKAKQFIVEPNEKAPVNLALPMSEERSQLFKLIPQLLEAVSYNVALKNDSVALYEVGSVFYQQSRKLSSSCAAVVNICAGSWGVGSAAPV